MGHHKCCKKPDISLKSDTEVQLATETPRVLPMFLKKCDYTLVTSFVETHKKNRQLKVSGSVTGKVLIEVLGETLRLFEFENEQSFSLTEDLKKGDYVTFYYQGDATSVDMKAEIVKK